MTQDNDTPAQVNTQRRILELSADILTEPPERILYARINEDFPWLKFGEFIWARSEDFRSAIFWAVPGAEPVQLNGDDALERLADVLRVQTGPLPSGLSPVELAGAVRQLTVDPRALIASRELLWELEPELEDWLKSDTKADRDHFARQCTDPKLARSSQDESWSLAFNAFNPAGGVEKWQVTGDKARLLSAAKSVAVRDGTFFWPMA